jgi:hypothetical protein
MLKQAEAIYSAAMAGPVTAAATWVEAAMAASALTALLICSSYGSAGRQQQQWAAADITVGNFRCPLQSVPF